MICSGFEFHVARAGIRSCLPARSDFAQREVSSSVVERPEIRNSTAKLLAKAVRNVIQSALNDGQKTWC